MDGEYYGIRVIETYGKTFAVKANSLEEAMNYVEQMYNEERIEVGMNNLDDSNVLMSEYFEKTNGVIPDDDVSYYEKLDANGEQLK